MPNSGAKLFQPIRVGNLELSHRVVLAPLTRFRADDVHVPTDMMVDMYTQRASTPGTLLIAEGTFIAAKAGGYDHIPGIWNDAQIEGWKKIVDAVHSQGSYIYIQVFANGRAAQPAVISQPDSPKNPGGPHPYVSASDIPLSSFDDGIKPRALTHEEILEYIELHGQASHNAVHITGFDGIEIHCAHGSLIDQFTQDVTNKRMDKWGGSIENRIRFALEVTKKVVSLVGEERTGIRLSPFSTFQGMRMDHPYPTFAQFIARVREAYPRFAYLHVVEPRTAGSADRTVLEGESNDFFRGYTPESALEDAEDKDELIVFGRYFTSNPDLPARIKNNIPLTPYNRNTLYTAGRPEGYIDYAFADAETEASYKAKKSVRD